VVDKATSAAERYYTDALPCGELELTARGDILVHGLTTGHDWSTEELGLNRSAEILSLGPWTPPDATDTSYRFELSAPECGACRCTRLVRRDGTEDVLLELGRACD
jgi:hypothetical protein